MDKRAVTMKGDDYVYVHTVYGEGPTTFFWEYFKADKTMREDKIDIVEAASVFYDVYALPEQDENKSTYGRYIGMSQRLRMLVVVHAEFHPDWIRIVTAYPASHTQEKRYAEKPRPKGEVDTRRRRKRKSERDPRRGRRRPMTFMELFRLHHPSYRPMMYQLPEPGFRSRLTGSMARMQERGWKTAHMLKLRTAGERVAAIRKAMKLSQSELSRRSGVDQSSISRIERGLEKLGIRRAEALSKVLGVAPAALLWGKQ